MIDMKFIDTEEEKKVNILNLFPLLSIAAAAIKFANVGLVDDVVVVVLVLVFDGDDNVTVFCFK